MPDGASLQSEEDTHDPPIAIHVSDGSIDAPHDRWGITRITWFRSVWRS